MGGCQTVTVRVAVFDEEYGIATDDDLTQHHAPTSTYAHCISKYFRDEVTTSNFELPIEELNALLNDGDSGRYRVNGRPKFLRNDPYPIEELTTFRDYNNLLAGSFNADPRYTRHFNHYGNIPINGNALTRLAAVFPRYFEYSPWKRTAATDGPSFRTDNIPSSAETPQRYGTDTVMNDVLDTDADNATSEAHDALVNFIANYLVQQGYTILAVIHTTLDIDLDDPDPTTQSYFPGDSQPDIVAEKDDEITIFEAEVNDSNPVTFLKNLERAYHFDYNVVVVTEDEADLERKLNHASLPVDETDTTTYGTRLYNFSDDAIESDTVTYLFPPDVAEAQWYLSHDNTLTLRLNTNTDNPSGDIEAPLHSFTYPTPRYRKDGSEYIVTAASGEHLGTYASKHALRQDFTPLK